MEVLKLTGLSATDSQLTSKLVGKAECGLISGIFAAMLNQFKCLDDNLVF